MTCEPSVYLAADLFLGSSYPNERVEGDYTFGIVPSSDSDEVMVFDDHHPEGTLLIEWLGKLAAFRGNQVNVGSPEVLEEQLKLQRELVLILKEELY